MNFASDNGAGAAPEILEAIASSSRVNAPAYGADDYTARAAALLSDVFETHVAAFSWPPAPPRMRSRFRRWPSRGRPSSATKRRMSTTTSAALRSFSPAARNWSGSPERAARSRPRPCARRWRVFRAGSSSRRSPGALSLSQATESGTIYRVGEIAELCDIAHEAGIGAHMDGARFANALVASGLTAAELTWRAGIDALSFGATKNGALACEAVVFFDPALAQNFAYLRKRGGHTLSKGRFLGAQMEAYLKNGLWLRLAGRANDAARRLSEGLANAPGVRLAWPTEANEVFVVAPDATVEAWRAGGAKLHDWSTRSMARERAPREGETLVRLVTSFETKAEEIDRLVALCPRPAGAPAPAP